MKVLVVEQHPSLRAMIRSILDLGHAEISEACDATSALRAYSAMSPDWVLMDLSLNDMNGLDATKLLKKQYPDAHVMLVTDIDSLTLRQKAREAGAGGVLVKDQLFKDLRRTNFLPSKVLKREA